jgi:hypothetical protein
MIFKSLLQNQQAKFSQTWYMHNLSLGEENSSLFVEGPCPLQRRDNHINVKNGVGPFKNLLLQNHWANLNQTCHKSFLGEGDSSLFKRKG